jgi:uncharacterized coiled-coil protein SlyX
VAAVEEQLRVLIARLSQLGGTADDHRLTAYSQLLSALSHDVETAVFNVDRRAVTNLRNDQIAAKVEAEQQLHAFNERLARKEQTILSLQAEQANMDFKNKSLIRTVELLSKELEKCNSSLSDLHQRAVEFRMQALDFKAEVDKRAQRVQQSVQARVGFVPETIQKHINQLTALLVSLLVFLCYRGQVRYAVAIAYLRSRSLLLLLFLHLACNGDCACPELVVDRLLIAARRRQLRSRAHGPVQEVCFGSCQRERQHAHHTHWRGS